MFEEASICPYTGLRSFTEEESLYFKGREEHIEHATEQLQRNKFLMLTGASGDGKSSLVYAGIVPNARAGFLKSKYTQWCVADFRPERSPFKNLCKSLARQLGIGNPGTVEAELHHGFSAIVDLYKNSKRFIDSGAVAWDKADEAGKASMKREAANLLILVDQFEEFFTNPENYRNGVPSRDSNLVLNLLLETARIAVEEDLPIYVVFTMRSDFIGQCAAFRGLPEYIGYSQFFVPRLNRSQLQQVIEEPATLSGNKITRRLTERLIHDINDGVDQLPILQHALNQIWLAANSGKEEMDLLHYAMVGGMSVEELPDTQVERFKIWFGQQPKVVQDFYREPNLQNVLDTHTNKLFEQAAAYYSEKTGKPISETDAKVIIKTVFACLTKIDQSRAVRNRMTLQEITHILGRPEFDTGTVGALLNIFREPGNTFIRPFITEESGPGNLKEDDVLDITHESLIRNWELLERWAQEEYNNYTISLDFEKQLDRWIQSNKSSGFLLSIGPLTYFENWYNRVNPNTWWIARYLPDEEDQKKKLAKAEMVRSNAHEFIGRSASKHAVTRAIIRYGPKRIAALLAIVGFFTLSSFVVKSYWQKRNAYVLGSIKEQAFQLANSKKTDFGANSSLETELLKLGSTTVAEILAHVEDPLTRISVARRLTSQMLLLGRQEPKKEILEGLLETDKRIKEFPFSSVKPEKLTDFLKQINLFRATLEIAHRYNPSDQFGELSKENAEVSAALVSHVFENQPAGFKDISGLNTAMENAINHHAFNDEAREKLLSTLSPFEKTTRSQWVLDNYRKDELAVKGGYDYGFKFNGLYQELAYLYAAAGNSTRALQCIDTLLAYKENYFANDYTYMADNAANIAVVFYTYNHQEALNSFVTGYCQRKKINEKEFFERMIGRSNPTGTFAMIENGDIVNLNVQYGSPEQLEFIFAQYRKAIEKSEASAEGRNFYLAIAYKDQGLLLETAHRTAGKTENNKRVDSLFDKAFEHYRRVRDAYLNQPVTADESETNLTGKRKTQFLYPDYVTTFTPFEGRDIYYPYTSGAFMHYLLNKNLLGTFYTAEELPLITKWIQNYFIHFVFQQFTSRNALDKELLIALERQMGQKETGEQVDFNFLYLLLGNGASETGDSIAAVTYYNRLDLGKIMNLVRNTGPFGGNFNTQSFQAIGKAITGLVKFNHFQEGYRIVKVFKNPINRSSLYAFVARELLEKKVNGPMVQPMVDSARIELNRIENLSTGQPNRQIIAHVLVLQDPERNVAEAYRTIKNIGNKFDPTVRIAGAFAFHDDLFGATENIIDNISDSDRAQFFRSILYGYSRNKGRIRPEWNQFSEIQSASNRFMNYINEDN